MLLVHLADKPHKIKPFKVAHFLKGFLRVAQNQAVAHEVTQVYPLARPEKLIKPRLLFKVEQVAQNADMTGGK